MAESINSLYKSELIYNETQGPWRTVEDVELATLGWVEWFNTSRLLQPVGNIPPIEFEANWRVAQENRALRCDERPSIVNGAINHRNNTEPDYLAGLLT